jgi:hypothetical protein
MGPRLRQEAGEPRSDLRQRPRDHSTHIRPHLGWLRSGALDAHHGSTVEEADDPVTGRSASTLVGEPGARRRKPSATSVRGR